MMKSLLIRFIVLWLNFVALGVSAQVNAQTGTEERAKSLWEEVIAAKGGRERLFSIRTLVVSSQTKYHNPPKGFSGNRLESLFVLPDKWWSWVDEPGFGLSVWTYDFGSQIGQEAMSPFPLSIYRPTQALTDPVEISRNEKDDARYAWVKQEFLQYQLIYLMETKWLHPNPVEARTERVGYKKVDVVEVSSGRQRYAFYLDPKTRLPIKVIIKTWIERMKDDYVDGFILNDYSEVAGIMMPRNVSRDGKNETTYQINVNYDEGIFMRPPTLEMGPETWKSKRR